MRNVARRSLAGVVLGLTALAGCGGNPAPDATPPAATTAPAPPPAPPAKACYDLGFRQVLQPTDNAAPVPCTARHTTETLYVGRIDPLVDGHLLAIDSDRVQQQIARSCRARLATRIGGSEEDRRLSRLQASWFSPTLAQGEAGALWYRCDLVFASGPEQLAPLPRDTHGLLDAPNALDTYGTCGSTSPANPRFQRISCNRPHAWRIRGTLDLPAGAKYLGKAAGAAADSRCRDVDARIAADSLKLKWSFEWPTQQQWDAGQRYGFCWTPDPA
jgi:hypothetical protein